MFKQLKQFLFITYLVFFTVGVFAQQKPAGASKEMKGFARVTKQANISFTIPEGFKEVSDKDGANPFDYGITIPDQSFEIWFKIYPQKGSDSDSLYLDMGKNEARLLAGENNYLARNLTPEVLADYNADAGKTYFMSLPDSPVTKHFKYALLVTLQKNHKGIIMAAGFSNDKGPDFFKNLSMARNCIKFKSPSS